MSKTCRCIHILLESWIVEKDLYEKNLKLFYIEHYGEKETDIWYEQPTVNVWVFARDEKIITLKSHILTGEVEEHIENN